MFRPIPLVVIGGVGLALALPLGCDPSVREFGGGGGAGGTTSSGDMMSSSSGTPTACSTDADCPVITACAVPSCDLAAGTCVGTPIADGPLPGAADAPNDCIDAICSGGVETTAPDDTEYPDFVSECSKPSCVGGVATYNPLPAAMACNPSGTGLCDGAGTCVDCLADGVKNGLETDLDCGGAGVGCAPCDDGKTCNVATDCVSANCCVACNGVCIPAGVPCNPC